MRLTPIRLTPIRLTIAMLTLAYVLSQFYRAFLAVMAPTLAADLGILPQVLAQASGWWFLAFALAQLPVGWALDRIGPRITVAGLMAVAAVGAVVFARATGPGQINLAMILIGIGCSPVLMGAYFIFAREFPARQFGTLAGMVIGVGSFGNLAASAPLTWAVALMGWRGAMWGLAAVTLTVALVLAVLVRDPERVQTQGQGTIWTLLGMRHLWPIFILMAACYAPAAGLRGLWAGPYLAEVFAADATRIGLVTLIMGLAMVAGNFAYGPLERLLNSRKWLNFGGNALSLTCLLTLMALPGTNWILSSALLAGVGFFGASFPMVIAHGRAFLPPALVGRGVTLMNLFGIGTAGLMQMATGQIYAALPGQPQTAYAALFAAYAALVIAGLTVYLWSQDRTD